ncbi:hypothetical protein SCUCBS95973_000763 [Sporothrix curviconia]|uniref:Adhesin domain-containing protein n=1 Tax=Sporothrix curviconia TaxID=1260050 RepID=A0ABP0AT12_9PEZI
MADKQPLLAAHQRGEAQPHMDEYDTSGLHADAREIYIAAAAAAARQRRRQAVRRVHFLGFLLFLIVGYYTHGFGLPKLASTIFHWRSGYLHNGDDDGFLNIGSTPLEGPLVLPDSPQCHLFDGRSEPHAYPLARYPLEFGHSHGVTVLQNTTLHLAPPDEPPYDNDGDYRWRYVHVTGETVVRHLGGGGSGGGGGGGGKGPSVEVEAVSNDDRIHTRVVFDKKTQRLSVVVDDRIWVEREHWHDGQGACLVVRITVWVPPAEYLETFRVGAVHLGVQLLEDLDLRVDESARLTSVVGSIVGARTLKTDAVHKKDTRDKTDRKKHYDAESFAFPSAYRFEAKELDVATTSSPIRGPWSLLDRLHIFSVSGSLGVSVRAESKEEEEEAEGLADLRIETVSGDVGFEEVKHDDKKEEEVSRPHRLSLSTRSGTLHGSGSFAESGRVTTTSGNIVVALTPHKLAANNNDDKSASLDSSTVSGTTVVYLLKEAHGEPIDFLESTHHAVSGSITLKYPASWVGDIHLETLAGKLEVEGKGVHVVPDDSPRWPPKIGRKVDAIKESSEGGETDEKRRSSLRADTVSGRVQLLFPE